jgi:hypothetical protein
VHLAFLRVEYPVFADSNPQIFLALGDEVALPAAGADDLDDDVRDPLRPDVAVGGWRVEVNRPVGMTIRGLAGKSDPALGAAGLLSDDAGVSFIIAYEQASDP